MKLIQIKKVNLSLPSESLIEMIQSLGMQEKLIERFNRSLSLSNSPPGDRGRLQPTTCDF